MITAISSAELWSPLRMGLAVVDGNRPSSSLLAEYLRASLCSAYDGNPVHIHTILGVTEERLSSVFSFQSSLQSKLFREENDDDSSRIELKEVLGDFEEAAPVLVGDFFERFGLEDAEVVNQNVHLGEAGDDGLRAALGSKVGRD